MWILKRQKHEIYYGYQQQPWEVIFFSLKHQKLQAIEKSGLSENMVITPKHMQGCFTGNLAG